MAISLLKFLDGPWETARGYLREDLDHLEAALNTRWANTFGDANQINLTLSVSGILPVVNGGTGLAAYAVGDLPYASGVTTIGRLPIGAVNTILWSNGGVPSWTGSPVISTQILVGTLGPVRADTSFESVKTGGKQGILVLDSTSPGDILSNTEAFITFYGYNSASAIKQMGSMGVGWHTTTAGAEKSIVGFHPNKASEAPDNSLYMCGGLGVTFWPTNKSTDYPGDHLVRIRGGLQILDTNGSYRLLIGDLDSSNTSDGAFVQGTNDGSVGGITQFSRSQANATPDSIAEFVQLQHNNNTAKAGFIAVGLTSDFHILTQQATAGTGYDITKAKLSILSAGNVGIIKSLPTARLHIGAGSATAGTGSLKLDSGTILTVAEAGVHEYNGNHYLSNSAIRFPVGGPLFDHYADVGNGTTVETDLYADTVAANTFKNNGDKVEATYGGIYVPHATATRQLRLYYGGTLIFDSGALAIAAGSDSWEVFATLIRVSSSVVRTVVTLTTTGATLNAYATYTSVTGLTLTGTTTLTLTGQAAGVGAATNDIVAKIGAVGFSPAA